MVGKRVLSTLKGASSAYILVNIFVSFLGFIRSFIFLRWLDSVELGIISLVQTVMQFIGLFQLGLINGGYRIFALGKLDNQTKVNNTIFTYIYILSYVFILLWTVLLLLGKHIIISNRLLFVALFTGIFSLINNWLNNTLIAKRKLKNLNIINLIAGFSSLLLLALVPIIGFWGAIISISIQPLLFVVLVLSQNKELRPNGILVDFKLVKYILSFGFIPFLAGIFTMLNLQIERWSIAGYLGTESLGCFYLVFLYNSLYLLVPNSTLNIFYPQAVKAYDDGDIKLFKHLVKKQLIVLLIYNIIVISGTVLFIKPVISFLFPNQIENIIYVYYFIPGLIAMSFIEVTSLILNSTVRLKPILIGGILSVLLYIISIPLFVKLNYMTLTNMAILKSGSLVVPFIVQYLYIILNWKKIKIRDGYKKNC